MQKQQAHQSQFHTVTKDLLSDPGFGFAVCNILYVSKVNSVAIAAAFFCALSIILLRVLRHMHPLRPAGKSRLVALAHNEKFSLRFLGTIIILSSLYTLLITPYSGLWSYAVLQASAGILFATGNFMLANAYDQRNIFQKTLMGLLTQAETWMAGGMLCLGLMAGPMALLVAPFVILGYKTAFANILHKRSEHQGHPKLYYALATLCFAGITTDPVLVCANIINTAYLVLFEARLTPGGLSQIIRDLRKEPKWAKARHP